MRTAINGVLQAGLSLIISGFRHTGAVAMGVNRAGHGIIHALAQVGKPGALIFIGLVLTIGITALVL
jgi:hypothetical protein